MTQYYQYTPLPIPTNTRILGLDKGLSDTVIGSLRLIGLNRGIPYNCLLYCWSGPRTQDVGPEWTTPVKSITPDGIEVPVRQNLYDALRSLLRLELIEPIWVDALCIDQNHDGERNSQVTQIASIYSSATNVLVWLGEQTSNTRMAVDSMSQLSFSQENVDPSINSLTPVTKALPNIDLIRGDFGHCKFTGERLVAMIRFFVGNVWFSRVCTL